MQPGEVKAIHHFSSKELPEASLHHPESLEKILKNTTNPYVYAVVTMFDRANGAMTWTAAMEYLAVSLMERCDALEAELLKLKSESPCPSLILPPGY